MITTPHNRACRQAYDDFYHKIRAEISYDYWCAIWRFIESRRSAPAPAFSVDVHGVGIIDDNPSALAVYFNAAPNNDDIRALHEIVTNAPVAAQVQPEGVTLDGCLETLFRLGEYLGVDYAASRKAPGAPSGVYIKAIEEKGFKARDAALEEAAVAMEQTSRQGGALVIRALKSGSEAQQPVSGADASRGSGVTWADAQKLAGMPAVDSALEVFCNGGTAENALALVRAVMIAQQDADKVDAERWRVFLKTANQKGGLIVRWYDHSDLRTRPASRLEIERLMDAARKEQA